MVSGAVIDNRTVIATRHSQSSDMLLFEPGEQTANVIGHHDGECVWNYSLTRDQALRFSQLLHDWVQAGCRKAKVAE